MSVVPDSPGSGPGAFRRALRPALLGVTASGLLPVSCSDGSWRLCSVPAGRSALISALLLALYLVCVASQPGAFFKFSSAVQVFKLIRLVQNPVRLVGMFVWLWASAPQLQAYARACRQYEERFGPVDLRPTARYVRRYASCVVLLLFSFPFNTLENYAEYPVWFQASMTVSLCGTYSGISFWTVLLDGACWSLADGFRGIDERLQSAVRKGNIPQLRRLAHQHGHLSRLSNMFCRTFGGFLAAHIYTTLLDISLGLYLYARPFDPVEGTTLVRITAERLISPLRLLLLKLTTDAGHRVVHRSRQAAELLRDHMLATNQATEDPDFVEIVRRLEERQVDMNMAGYFILDKELFIQSVKDIFTLLIALAQFDMAAPGAGK